jgi:adenylate cyclase
MRSGWRACRNRRAAPRSRIAPIGQVSYKVRPRDSGPGPLVQDSAAVLSLDIRLAAVLGMASPERGAAFAREHIAACRGRVFAETADGLLAEFATAADATRCAIRLQESRDGDKLRLGVDLAEVEERGGRLSGEGVDVAKRLMAVAEPGVIAVSGAVFDQVAGRLPLVFDEPMRRDPATEGRPARIYRARQGTPRTAPTLVLPAQPSVAVLPFLNMSGDSTKSYFSDGITEDVITELSRFRSLFVIARNSSFAYRGQAVDLARIGRELGVQYVLEGSVRHSGNRVRLTAQLTDVANGRHIWAERYDRRAEDIFTVQDELSRTIAGQLVGRLQHEGIEQAKRKRPDSLRAYDYFLRSLEPLNRWTRADCAAARALLEKAVELDPHYAEAYARLATTYLFEWFFEDQPTLLDRAAALADQALALDETDSWSQITAGRVRLYRGQHETAELHYERAVALNPNDADIAASLGLLLAYTGRPEEGASWVQRAMRLNPGHPDWYAENLGTAQMAGQRYRDAIASFRLIANPPAWLFAYLAISLVGAGSLEEARVAAAEAMRRAPGYGIQRFLRSEPFRDAATLARLTDALRRAGFPD